MYLVALMSENKDKVVLVTGAGGELGCELVKNLLDEGYTVVSQYRSRSLDLFEVYGEHYLDAGRWCHQADLTNEAGVQRMHDRMQTSVLNSLGSVWGVVNLAGASRSNGMSWKLTREQFSEALETNLVSMFLMCKQLIPDMRAGNSGRIINVSSIVGFSGVAGASHYAAAKAGVVGFTKSLALELANKNITANTLALGYFDKGIIDQVPGNIQDMIKAKSPINRFGKSEELVGAVKYLLSDPSAFYTGQTLHLNGGLYV